MMSIDEKVESSSDEDECFDPITLAVNVASRKKEVDTEFANLTC
jgi:hypothetical protein